MNLLSLWRRPRKDPRKMTAMEDLGFLVRESDDQYRAQAKDRLTSHELADFRKDPFLYHKKKLGLVIEEDRPAFALGRATHALVLEGRERYQERYAFGGPVNPKTGEPYGRYTKAFEEWAAAQGKPVITGEDASLIESLNESVRSHQVAAELLAEGVAEGVVRTPYLEISCQARLDWLNPRRGIVDLKTCDHLSWFEAEARGFGYLHQMAFYRALVFQVAGQLVPVHLIAVEKREPFRCGVWVIGQDVLAAAQKENEQAMERLKLHQRLDRWPTGYEDLRTVDYL